MGTRVAFEDSLGIAVARKHKDGVSCTVPLRPELLNGNGADLHRAMIAVEKADLSFQLMMQVRNKIVAAYQEVSRLQF